jgi:hypothetical protein
MAAIVDDAPASLQVSDHRVNSANHTLRVNALRPRRKRPGKAAFLRSVVVVVSLPLSALPTGKPRRAAKLNRSQITSPAVSLETNAVLIRHRENRMGHVHAIPSDPSSQATNHGRLDLHARVTTRPV